MAKQYLSWTILFVAVLCTDLAAYAGSIRINPDHKKWMEVLSAPPLAITVPQATACQPTVTGKVRGLLIGVEDYEKPLAKLAGSGNDVRLLEKAIRERYPDARLDVRLNEAASRAGIVDGLQKLAQEARCGDFVWVHYSGYDGRAAGIFGQEVESFLPILREGGVILPYHSSIGGRLNPDAILRATDVSQWLTVIRNSGAFVFVSIDTCSAAAFSLFEQQRSPDQQSIWSLRAGKKDSGIFYSEPEVDKGRLSLKPEAGGMGVFYSSDREGLSLETLLPKDGTEQKTFGLFSFALGSALQLAPPDATIKQVAKSTVELFLNNHPGTATDTRNYPVFVSTEPDHQFLAPSAKPDKNRSEDSIRIMEPPLLRGTIRLPKSETVIVGKLDQPQNIFHAMLNGRPLSFDRNGLFRASAKLKPGENELTILTFYRDYSHAEKRVPVTVEGSLEAIRGTGRQFAVIIANDSYSGTGYGNLLTPLKDGLALQEILERRYGFHTKIAAPDGTSRDLLLLNADKDRILETLESLRAFLGPDDSLLVYYAGHGEYIEKLDRAYWVPVNGREHSERTWIPATELSDSLKMLSARHILVVADSCYSGALNRSGSASGGPGNEERSRYIENMFKRPSRVLLSSGGVEPVADGGGDGHSVFARALISGLTEIEEQVFTAEELYSRHIKARVVGSSSQSPQYKPLVNSGHEGGDFVFRRQVGEEPNRGN